MVIHLSSPDGSRDQLYISNYATLQVKDVLARLDGVGDVQHLRRARLFDAHLARSGEGRGAQPDRRRRRRRAAGAERPGRLRRARTSRRCASPGAFQLNVETLGRLIDPRQFANIIVRTDPERAGDAHPRRRAASSSAPRTTAPTLSRRAASGAAADLPAARVERAGDRRPHQGDDGGAVASSFPPGLQIRHRLQPHRVHRRIGERGVSRRSSRRSSSWSSS